MSLTLTIDGRLTKANTGETILACAQRHNISIPHLCIHPNLAPFGACRLCIVQVEGMRGYPSSCSTPVAEGMVVHTNTPELQDLRRKILELILLEHPSTCLVCGKSDLCEQIRPKADKAGRTTGCHSCNNKETCEIRALSEQLGLSDLPVPPFYRDVPVERSDPFIDRDLNLCILCGRCVRICKHQHQWATIDFVGRGSQTHIGEAFGRSLLESGCRFCGSCVDVCPTGSLSDRYAKWRGQPDQVTQTTCIFCDEACAVEVSAQRGRLFSAKAVNTDIPLCVLGRFGIAPFLNGTNRLKEPYVRVGSVMRETPWEKVIAEAAQRLQAFKGSTFALVCDTTSTLEDRHVFQRFAHEVMQSLHYIEIEPDPRGISRSALPEGTRAALLTGDLVLSEQLETLELLIVLDCYPTATSDRAHILFPVAVFAEVAGTRRDVTGCVRPLRQAAKPPGRAKPEWEIVCEIAKHMQGDRFAYPSVGEITKDIGITDAALRVERDNAPMPATNPRTRRTHFRGHCIADTVRGLNELPLDSANSVKRASEE